MKQLRIMLGRIPAGIALVIALTLACILFVLRIRGLTRHRCR